jgi:hypothetical protein
MPMPVQNFGMMGGLVQGAVARDGGGGRPSPRANDDLMGGIQKGTQPHPFFDLNPEFQEWQALMGQVDTGRLSLDEAYKIHRQKWGYEDPPTAKPKKGLPGLTNSWDR